MLSEHNPVTLPPTNPPPEEFAEFIFRLVAVMSNHEFDSRENRRSWSLHGSSLYLHAALEAHRLEIPQSELYPIASLVHNHVVRPEGTLRLRASAVMGGLYVISRPPAYLSRLASLMLPHIRYPEFGSMNAEPIVPSSIVLPDDWYGSPLFLTHATEQLFWWNRLRTFRPGDFASPEEAAAHLPNNQTRAFYERALVETATPYVETRSSVYLYSPSVRPATPEEVEVWFSNFIPNFTYRFAEVEMPDILVNYLGVNLSRLLADQPSAAPRAEAPVSVTPGVLTDVQPPPGTLRPIRPRQARDNILRGTQATRRGPSHSLDWGFGERAETIADEFVQIPPQAPQPQEEAPVVATSGIPAQAITPYNYAAVAAAFVTLSGGNT